MKRLNTKTLNKRITKLLKTTTSSGAIGSIVHRMAEDGDIEGLYAILCLNRDNKVTDLDEVDVIFDKMNDFKKEEKLTLRENNFDFSDIKHFVNKITKITVDFIHTIHTRIREAIK